MKNVLEVEDYKLQRPEGQFFRQSNWYNVFEDFTYCILTCKHG